VPYRRAETLALLYCWFRSVGDREIHTGGPWLQQKHAVVTCVLPADGTPFICILVLFA